MKLTKKIILIVMSILLALTIGLQFTSGLTPLLSIGTGFLFIYYLIVYLLILYAEKIANEIFIYIVYFLVYMPFNLVLFQTRLLRNLF